MSKGFRWFGVRAELSKTLVPRGRRRESATEIFRSACRQGFGFAISGFGFGSSGFEFRVLDFGFGGEEFGCSISEGLKFERRKV